MGAVRCLGGGCREARACGTPRRGGKDDPAPGVADVCHGRAGPPALRHRRRALLSLHSNGYINIISPATCPVTDILMTLCGARAAPGRDVHRARGPARAGASPGASRTWDSTLQGGQGDILGGGKALGQRPRTQPVFSLGDPGGQESLPEVDPNISGCTVRSACGSRGSMPDLCVCSQALAPRKTLPLAFTRTSTLQSHGSE